MCPHVQPQPLDPNGHCFTMQLYGTGPYNQTLDLDQNPQGPDRVRRENPSLEPLWIEQD